MNKNYIRYAISLVVLTEAALLAVTGVVALIYQESVYLVYFATAAIVGAIGYLGYRRKPKSNVFYAKEGFIIVSLSWLILSFIGAIPFYITREIPEFVDALFETASGFTTTGASILDEVEHLSHASLFWRSFTHWIGGMGVLVFVLSILPSAGGYAMNIMKAESPGPSVGKLVSRVSDTAKILYTIYIGITIAEIMLLVIFKMPLFDAICASFQTAGTGGFSNYNAGMSLLPVSQQIILTIFMILFGVNFNVYYLVLIGKGKEALKSEEVKAYLSIILVSSLLITANTLHMSKGIASAFQTASFQVASIITTTGFSTIDFNQWPSFSTTILVTLMFIGACAGSTGGGIKVSRIVIAIKDSINSLTGFAHPRLVKPVKFEGKVLDKDMLSSVRRYFAVYIVVFAVSILLVSINNFDYTTNFTAVAATLNNIGPGLNVVGPTMNYSSFSVFSKIVLIFDMLAGRLELIPMLMLFVPATYRHNG